MSAPQLLPNWELAQRSARGVAALTIEQAGLQSADPLTSLLRAVLPMHDVENVLSIYAGLPLLVLAGLGVASSWSSTAAGFNVGLTAVTWVLAWGTHGSIAV